MTELEYMTHRIGIMEQALSGLIQGEMATLQPSGSRWALLDSIDTTVKAQLQKLEGDYKNANKTVG